MPAGRRPKPTAVKIAEGNPGKRPLNRNEPQFGGFPKCPAHLDAEARKEWKRISNELAAVGLVSAVDRAALSAYCQCWSRWCSAEKEIQQTGAVIKSPKSGYPVQNPFVGIANTALDQMRKFLIEFGLTPASRSRISLDLSTNTAEDSFDAFMRSAPSLDSDQSDDQSEATQEEPG
jgi:P27 family predicted phage terminase small subunit